MDENRNVKQSLVIKNRNLVTIDGVNNVEGFDEGYVALSSTAGRIIIEGENLKIEGLTKDGGEILISGKIDAVSYAGERSRSGFFGRFFK